MERTKTQTQTRAWSVKTMRFRKRPLSLFISQAQRGRRLVKRHEMTSFHRRRVDTCWVPGKYLRQAEERAAHLLDSKCAFTSQRIERWESFSIFFDLGPSNIQIYFSWKLPPITIHPVSCQGPEVFFLDPPPLFPHSYLLHLG